MSELKKTIQDHFKKWRDNLKPTVDQDQWSQVPPHETPKTKTRIMPGESRPHKEDAMPDLYEETPVRPGPLENSRRWRR
jgi:hypothetical protein